MRIFLLSLLGVVALGIGSLYFGQASLIYFPQRYAPKSRILKKLDSVSYLSDGKKQWVYLPKRDRGTPPERVWWFFGGNGAVAWNWIDLVEAINPEINQNYILFDYPGYGYNEGRPSPESIAQAIDEAIPAISEHLRLEVEQLLDRSHAIGHSLGAAVALDFGNRHEVDDIIAISPFTTMEDMAVRQMGALLGGLLTHRYDNEVSVDAIVQREGVSITIFHGDRDTLIPHQMGKELAQRDQGNGAIHFVSVPMAGHNDILDLIEPMLIETIEME